MNIKATNAAQDIQEMMNGWNKIEAAARAQFPSATDDELFQLASGAMKNAMGMK